MNIFVLDSNPKIAAEYHVDRHVVKMILESAQMMSTTVRLINKIDIGYKLTHQNHPCTIWTRASLSNYLWLGSLSYYLNEEFKYRFNHKNNHKSFDVIMQLPIPNLPDIGLTQFAQAMPDIYKWFDTTIAYRNYYIGEKSHIFKWTKRQTPKWIN